MRSAMVVGVRALSPLVRLLTFDPGPGFSFEPGQWVSLRIPDGAGSWVARSYSIASAPRKDGTIDLAIGRSRGGPGSAFLRSVRGGERVPMSVAQGILRIGPLDRPLLMVASGTGVAPFHAMLASAAHDASVPPITMLQGALSEDELLFRDAFERLAARTPWFHYAPTLSQGAVDWRGRRGLVQTHAVELARALGTATRAMLAGHGGMVRDVAQLLEVEAGIGPSRVHAEGYG